MKFELALIAIVGTATASRLGAQKEIEYQGFAARVGRNIQSLNEYERRLGNFLKNDAFINKENQKSQESGQRDPMKLGHNITSDMDDDEYERHFMGAIVPDNVDEDQVLRHPRDLAAGEELEDGAMIVGEEELPSIFDHVAENHMN